MQKSVDKGFVKRTAAVWQQRYVEPIGEEDAQAIAANVVKFLDTLMEWDLRSQRTRDRKETKQGEDNGKQK